MDIKVIPGTKNFKASSDGKIYDSNGNERVQYVNGDGYKTSSVLLNDGRWVTFGVHRLVALAHIPCDGNQDELIVNHRDFNILNNGKENLEWITNEQNIIHAALMKGSENRPIIIAENPEGDFSFIQDMQKAAELLHVTVGEIWDAIKNKESINGWKLKHNNSKKALPEQLRKPTIVDPNLVKTKIKFYDILKKTTKKFDSFHDAGVYFNTSASHIFQAVSTENKTRVFKKRYLVVKENDDFPKITKEEYLKIISSGGKEVIAFNVAENKYYIYKSASSFIKEKNLSKKAVSVCLKKNQFRLIGGWYFTYLNDENIKRLKRLTNVQS